MVIVLLRGLMRDSRHWAGFEQRLRELGHKVICIDVPGSGKLAQQSSPIVLQDYCPALIAQIREQLAEIVSLDKQSELPALHIVGLSMGGMLATLLARQLESEWLQSQVAVQDTQQVTQNVALKVAKVSLLNSSAGNLSPWYQRFKITGLLSAFKRQLLSPAAKPERCQHWSWFERYTLQLTSVLHHQNAKIIGDWSQYRHDNKTSVVDGARQLLAAARFNAPQLTCPLQVIVGRDDKLVSTNCSENLSRFYSAELHVIDNAGHDVTLDKPREVAELLSG
ncbi:alpha/beta hydrolase [Shewanella maritima]|uniref:Alpha/beta hydrolase n=1 Tax=Shewanella maritima TaxID=2520507 RepID=A0A411PEW5_9GAMM|nr:alpha/beta hydrolase [Shewanella maritima]QBF82091.1 alpha/beta hydrolase [Shewanella maritima]